MSVSAWLLFFLLALILGGVNLVLWVEAAKRARRRARRAAMRRHCRIVGYPGSTSEDPYMEPWEEFVDTLEIP